MASIFTNKDKYKNNVQLMSLLNALEQAHKNKDAFKASLLLTRLKNTYNIKITVDKTSKIQ